MGRRKGTQMRKLAFGLAAIAILALTAVATDLLLGPWGHCEYRTTDLGIDLSVPGGRLLDWGSRASIETTWGLLGYRLVEDRRDDYFAPWLTTSTWRMLPLFETIVLTAALWTGAACLLLRCGRGFSTPAAS